MHVPFLKKDTSVGPPHDGPFPAKPVGESTDDEDVDPTLPIPMPLSGATDDKKLDQAPVRCACAIPTCGGNNSACPKRNVVTGESSEVDVT